MLDIDPALAEAQRQFLVCSSCRYCEGYCAVFPAIERRTEYAAADVAYIANLCHDCRACYQACMYTPPHEFAIDIPKLLSEARVRTYREFTSPRALAEFFGRRQFGSAIGIALVAAVLLLLGLTAIGRSGELTVAHHGPGAFYAIVPFLWMLLPPLVLSVLAVGVLTGGALSIIRGTQTGAAPPLGAGEAWRALWDGVALTYLRGAGGGCYYPELETPTFGRRQFHIVLVIGVLFALASTTTAAVYQDVLGRLPPYPLLSVPVVLGTLGGIGILVGSLGLLALKLRSVRELASPGARAMDFAFLALFAVVAASGLVLLALRDTAFMGTLLVVHLSAIAALFVTAPYGKFVHAPYRLASLFVYHLEEAREKQP